MGRERLLVFDSLRRRCFEECEFPGLTVNEESETPSITGTFGKGGPTLRLANSYGTIHLRKEEGGPPPPAGTHPQLQPKQPAPPAPATPPAPPKEKATSTHLRRGHALVDSAGDGV